MLFGGEKGEKRSGGAQTREGTGSAAEILWGAPRSLPGRNLLYTLVRIYHEGGGVCC